MRGKWVVKRDLLLYNICAFLQPFLPRPGPDDASVRCLAMGAACAAVGAAAFPGVAGRQPYGGGGA